MASEMLKSVALTSTEILGALARPLTRIIEATKETLTRTPPELAGDVIERGITLTGGSSLLHGLADRLRLETGTPVRVVDSPCTCIALGLGTLIEKELNRSRASVTPGHRRQDRCCSTLTTPLQHKANAGEVKRHSLAHAQAAGCRFASARTRGASVTSLAGGRVDPAIPSDPISRTVSPRRKCAPRRGRLG